MTVPVLNSLIREATTALRGDKNGCLVLPLRKRLWAGLGPRMVGKKRAQDYTGWHRRVRLAVLCVEKTLPVWDKVQPANPLPREVLALIQAYQAKQVRPGVLLKRLQAAWRRMEVLGVETKSGVEVLVGSASIRAGYVALGDEDFDSDASKAAELDQNRDPYDLDAGFYAAAAFSGDMYGGTEANVAKRRQFWRWYLKNAVPIAWAVI